MKDRDKGYIGIVEVDLKDSDRLIPIVIFPASRTWRTHRCNARKEVARYLGIDVDELTWDNTDPDFDQLMRRTESSLVQVATLSPISPDFDRPMTFELY